MTITLKNECIEAKILEKGAELSSLKLVGDSTEYIWNANPDYWKRHAPVLFPIVGKVVDNQYRIDDTTYNLGQHGFARDMKFSVVNQSESTVTLMLRSNDETLNVYPYKFELTITYLLEGNRISNRYSIKNIDDQPIYFSIGAHPGFNTPLLEDEVVSDYYFEFEKKEKAEITLLSDKGLLKREKQLYLNDQSIIALDDSLFKEGALVFDHLKSTWIALKSKKSKRSVKVTFDEFPFLGLWSKEEGAPFVCIEPWIGHADYEDFDEDFKKKEDQICLESKDTFTSCFEISIE